jgi:putative PIN family toxin of toxin-antitoxin system
MMRVCIDTNVWISGFVFSGVPAQILDLAMKQKFQLVLSSFILNEVERNLVSKFKVETRTAKTLSYRLAQIADVYEPNGSVHIVPNMHADNLVLRQISFSECSCSNSGCVV